MVRREPSRRSASRIDAICRRAASRRQATSPVCVANNACSSLALQESRYFAFKVLQTGQPPSSNRFAGRGKDRFPATSWQPGETGVPLLDGSLGSFGCKRGGTGTWASSLTRAISCDSASTWSRNRVCPNPRSSDLNFGSHGAPKVCQSAPGSHPIAGHGRELRYGGAMPRAIPLTREQIQEALESAYGQVSTAAELLNISSRTLARRLAADPTLRPPPPTDPSWERALAGDAVLRAGNDPVKMFNRYADRIDWIEIERDLPIELTPEVVRTLFQSFRREDIQVVTPPYRPRKTRKAGG